VLAQVFPEYKHISILGDIDVLSMLRTDREPAPFMVIQSAHNSSQLPSPWPPRFEHGESAGIVKEAHIVSMSCQAPLMTIAHTCIGALNPCLDVDDRPSFTVRQLWVRYPGQPPSS
jgi:hypothetical protein